MPVIIVPNSDNGSLFHPVSFVIGFPKKFKNIDFVISSVCETVSSLLSVTSLILSSIVTILFWTSISGSNTSTKSIKAFVHFPANTFPNQATELKDNTHFTAYGAYELAKCVVEGIKSARLGIAVFLKPGLPVFNPAQPDAFENWDWPMSPEVLSLKPDGN